MPFCLLARTSTKESIMSIIVVILGGAVLSVALDRFLGVEYPDSWLEPIVHKATLAGWGAAIFYFSR